jgi:hypothetical protein
VVTAELLERSVLWMVVDGTGRGQGKRGFAGHCLFSIGRIVTVAGTDVVVSTNDEFQTGASRKMQTGRPDLNLQVVVIAGTQGLADIVGMEGPKESGPL